MMNYEVDPSVLTPYLPAGVELDTWNDKYFISVVGFLFLDTRVKGIRVPFHQNFEEVNLRFYVRRKVGDEVRRGVVFVKEIVPKSAIAWVAKTVYNENYAAHRMEHDVHPPENGVGVAGYRWHHAGNWNHIEVKFTGPHALPEPGSEAEFITEHYWGYAAQPDGSTVEYEVRHPQWFVWNATEASLQCDVPANYGEAFVPALNATPHSAFVALGSKVAVLTGKGIPT